MDNGASSYRRYLDGDEQAFVEIVRDYKDGLILYLMSIVRDINAAEELAEDTFVKCGLKKPRFSGKSSFKTWLYAIARNLAFDSLRKAEKEKTLSLESFENLAEEESLENAYLKKARQAILLKAMKTLRGEYRQVLWLRYFEGFSAKETAKIMKKSVHNAEVLVSRARAALRTQLLKEGFTDDDL